MARLSYDPTDEPTGFTRMRPKTRHLKRFSHTQNRNRTIALSPCVATLPDGSQVIIRKSRNDKRMDLTPVGKSVKIRRRILKAEITTYIEYAERYHLNARRVAELFRTRRDNGYMIEHRIVNIETNATFRGGDY